MPFSNLFSFIVVSLSKSTVNGPEGLTLTKDSLQFSDKTPPSFDGYGNYEQFKENILWCAMTSIPCENRAPILVGQLTGQAQVTAKTLSLATLTSNIKLEKLISEMDKKFGCDCTTLLHNNVSAFSDYTWDKSMTIDEFVVGFLIRLDKIQKLELKDELKSHLRLTRANLDAHDGNIIVGSSGGYYFFQA